MTKQLIRTDEELIAFLGEQVIGPRWFHVTWNPLTNVADAMAVWDRVVKKGLVFCHLSWGHDRCHATIRQAGGDIYESPAMKTYQHAICIAAARAFGAVVEEGESDE